MNNSLLEDSFNRPIKYLRLSVTDRCDFRCVYCMAEDMTFLPRNEVLSLEELARIARAFVDLGVEKIRLTGGEPLVRRDCLHLVKDLAKIPGLRTLCMTTNGSRLEHMAAPLVDAGLQRINISLDSLKPERFKTLTRFGDLTTVLRGIEAARRAGFESIKINAVVMKNFNLDEVTALASFALERDIDISFIEEMPLGEIDGHSRTEEYIRSEDIRALLSQRFSLSASSKNSGGPSRYWRAEGYRGHIGFISPHSENFCESCNRVRVTASGKLLLCLGNEDDRDLKALVRQHEGDSELKKTLLHAMRYKPERHQFDVHDAPQILRFMNATGG